MAEGEFNGVSRSIRCVLTECVYIYTHTQHYTLPMPLCDVLASNPRENKREKFADPGEKKNSFINIDRSRSVPYIFYICAEYYIPRARDTFPRERLALCGRKRIGALTLRQHTYIYSAALDMCVRVIWLDISKARE